MVHLTKIKLALEMIVYRSDRLTIISLETLTFARVK